MSMTKYLGPHASAQHKRDHKKEMFRVWQAKAKKRGAKRLLIVRRSPERQKADRAYRARVKVWLKLPANSLCHCCIARNQIPKLSTNVHHKFGRGHRGELLMVERFWIPCCSQCHPLWIDANRDEARKLGLLAPKDQYNQMPRPQIFCKKPE